MAVTIGQTRVNITMPTSVGVKVDITIPDLFAGGFPKAAIFNYTRVQADLPVTGGDREQGVGFTDGVRQNGTVARGQSQATSQEGRASSGEAVLMFVGSNGVNVDAAMEFFEWIPDGVRLNAIDAAFGGTIDVAVTLLGGDDLSAYVNGLNTPANTTPVSITGMGFQPDAVIGHTNGNGSNAYNSGASSNSAGDSVIMLSFCDSALNQGGAVAGGANGLATTQSTTASFGPMFSVTYPQNNQGDAVDLLTSITSLDADGFTIARTSGTAQISMGYMALGFNGAASSSVETYELEAAPYIKTINTGGKPIFGMTSTAIFPGTAVDVVSKTNSSDAGISVSTFTQTECRTNTSTTKHGESVTSLRVVSTSPKIDYHSVDGAVSPTMVEADAPVSTATGWTINYTNVPAASPNPRTTVFSISEMASAFTPPTVDAGGPYSGNTGIAEQLDGTVVAGSDPSPTLLWTIVSGGTGTFSNNAIEDPTFTADTEAVYTLRLSADPSDGTAVTDDATFNATDLPTYTGTGIGPLTSTFTAIGTGTLQDVYAGTGVGVLDGGQSDDITYIGSGTAQVDIGQAPYTVPLPTGWAVNDILLLSIVSSGVDTQPTPTGYTVIEDIKTGTTSNDCNLSVYWKRAEAGEVDPTIPNRTTSNRGSRSTLLAYRGVSLDANPIDTSTTLIQPGNATSANAPAVTTTVDKCEVVNIAGHNGPDVTASNWSNSNLVSITERADTPWTVGDRCGLAMASGRLLSAGDSAVTSLTWTLANERLAVTVALKPSQRSFWGTGTGASAPEGYIGSGIGPLNAIFAGLGTGTNDLTYTGAGIGPLNDTFTATGSGIYADAGQPFFGIWQGDGLTGTEISTIALGDGSVGGVSVHSVYLGDGGAGKLIFGQTIVGAGVGALTSTFVGEGTGPGYETENYLGSGTGVLTDTFTGSGSGTNVDPVVGEQIFTEAGSPYSWTPPAGVTTVHVVCIGAGGAHRSLGGGGGGGLAYRNNIDVTGRSNITIEVGGTPSNQGAPGGDSYFDATNIVRGRGGSADTVSSEGGTGGSWNAGGDAGNRGGGDGGHGGSGVFPNGAKGGGGGAGTIGTSASNYDGGIGGGTSPLGRGADGLGADGAASDGADGGGGGTGPNYYGGGSKGGIGVISNLAQDGVVRVIWGPGRSFPDNAG